MLLYSPTVVYTESSLKPIKKQENIYKSMRSLTLVMMRGLKSSPYSDGFWEVNEEFKLRYVLAPFKIVNLIQKFRDLGQGGFLLGRRLILGEGIIHIHIHVRIHIHMQVQVHVHIHMDKSHGAY